MSKYEQGPTRAIARDFAVTESNTGKTQIAILFEILQEGPDKGKRITWYGFFTEAAFDRTLESCEHCGWDGEDPDFKGIGSKECSIVIEDEEYNGKTNAKVLWVNSLGGLKKDKILQGAPLVEFKQNLKAAILARKKREKDPDDMGF